MPSQLDICNSALAFLGATQIVSLEAGSKSANLCKAHVESCKEFVLSEHGWKCATKRVNVPQSLPAPIVDNNTWRQFDFCYDLPSDFIRLVRNNDSKVPWLVEGRQLLCNISAPLMIRYVWNVTDYGLITPKLGEVIAWYLASKISMPLIQNTNLTDRCFKSYDVWLSKAKFQDSSTSRSDEQQDHFYEEIRLTGNRL